jgi:hypothetical protein
MLKVCSFNIFLYPTSNVYFASKYQSTHFQQYENLQAANDKNKNAYYSTTSIYVLALALIVFNITLLDFNYPSKEIVLCFYRNSSLFCAVLIP